MLGVTYIKNDQVALSLDCVTRAAKLAKSSKAKFELLQKKGKLLSNLFRYEDSVACLEQAIEEYEEVKDDMTPKDRGHAAISQYALCQNYFMLGKSKKHLQKALYHWKQAESKRSNLPSDIVSHLSWGFRDVAQMLVAQIKPHEVLSHRECHYCLKVTDDVKKCSACKVAVYCSRDCQAKAWKAGHKKECTQKKATRKEEKKEFTKINATPKTMIDEHLIPKDLWKKGLKMMRKGKKDEAVWNLLVALFMDFSLDKYSNQSHIKNVVDQFDVSKPNVGIETDGKFMALVLSMVTHYGDKHPVAYCQDILRVLVTSEIKAPSTKITNLDDVNRRHFAMGVAHIFHARWLNRMYDLSRGIDPRENKKAFEDAAKCISHSRLYLDPGEWLTVQYELGYSHFDIMAFDEGKNWLKKFIDNLKESEKKNNNLSPHWKSAKKTAEQKLAMIPMMERAAVQFGGAFPF